MKSIYEKNKTMKMIGESTIYNLIFSDGEPHDDFWNVLKAHAEDKTNDIFHICTDIFALGYIYGKRAERAKRKKA